MLLSVFPLFAMQSSLQHFYFKIVLPVVVHLYAIKAHDYSFDPVRMGHSWKFDEHRKRFTAQGPLFMSVDDK